MSESEMQQDRSEDDILAAEYVLGVLSGSEQAALEQRARSDALFANRVSQWEERLSPMAEGFVAVSPRSGLKQTLDFRLFGQPRARGGFWSSLGLWRGIAGAAALAFLLALALPMLQPPATGERLAASLRAEGSLVTYLVLYDPQTGSVSLAHVSGEPVEGRDFQLWVARGEERPLSLGVIPAGVSTRVAIPDQLRDLMTSAAHMAISLEPPGGSPTGQPTGPVLAVGDLLDI